jgi:hypothetical protein
MQDRVVASVIRFEDLPISSKGSRRVIVRWSDGSEREALTWFDDSCGGPHKVGLCGVAGYADNVLRARISRA